MNKKLKLTIFLMLALICIVTTTVHATYQSRSYGRTVENALINGTTGFMTTVRQMETSGQVMGLSESINTSTGLASRSNNIDVHLQKNTEYGAMLILGVSDYGKQTGYINNTTGGLATTTGNKSGVYELGTGMEWVAGGVSSAKYNSRYYNLYSSTESQQHRGDAMVETKKWQSSSSADWVDRSDGGFQRGRSGVFSYSNYTVDKSYYARAAVVCGTGF